MEGMEFYQGSTDEGSSSPSKTTEGSVTDTGKSEVDLTSMDKLLEPPVASMSRAEGGQFEPVTPPTPQSPLAALAVFVDVNFTSALQMLRTAALAAVEEAKATFFLGSNGRFNITRSLHRGLEKLWIRPYTQLTSVNFDNVRLLLGSLQHQGHRCGLHTPTLGSSSGEVSAIDCIHEAAAHQFPNVEGTSLSCNSTDNTVDCLLPECEAFSSDSLPTTWRPFCRHDGTCIAPPVELLAAFADSKSAHKHRRNGFSLIPEGQELWTSAQKTGFHSTVGCVVGLCVRSLLDLYIQAIRSLQPALLPKRSVVLVSAVNVPMMFRVLEEHDLVVQPLDLDPHTLMPTEQSLQNAMQRWGSRVKALLCSHLYGGICDLQPLVDFSAKHKLLLIEDCAESFVGELYRGHPFADVSLFSFGLIKTCTSAGGGIATVSFVDAFYTLVRSQFVAARMRALQTLYPFSRRRTFFKKLCVTLGACGLQSEMFMKTLLRFCYVLGWNPGAFLQSFVSLPLSALGSPAIPSASQQKKRLNSWNLEEFIEQQLRSTRLARRLQSLGFQIPGSDADFKTFWLFPIVTPDGWTVSDFEAVLRENGLFAASDATTLVCCTVIPAGAEGTGFPKAAAELMSRIVYLPVNRTFTQQQLLQVEAAVAKACGCEPKMDLRFDGGCSYCAVGKAQCWTPNAYRNEGLALTS